VVWWHIGRVAAAVALLVGAAVIVTQFDQIKDQKKGSGSVSRNGPEGASHELSLTPISTEVPHPPPAQIVLTGATDSQYIAVNRRTSNAKVHLFWLYRTEESDEKGDAARF
jgi:hypothetical protein